MAKKNDTTELPTLNYKPVASNGEMESVQRGMAGYVAVVRERDALAAKVDMLNIDLQAAQAENKVLRDMLTFDQEQAELKETAVRKLVASYQEERDHAVKELARAETKFEDLFTTMVAALQGFRAKSGELVKKATE